jgi:divalent metal cation (Fe/Co/Zn/Cd) transporter
MDASLPPEPLADIRATPEEICTEGVSYRNLKTRMGESLVFITLDVIVPEHWSVGQGRDWRERIESKLKETRPRAQAATHLEPSAKASEVKPRREAEHWTDQSDLSDAAFTRFSRCSAKCMAKNAPSALRSTE